MEVTAGLSSNGILQDASGNIGHWALCMQIDLKEFSKPDNTKKTANSILKSVLYRFGSQKVITR
jgi:hypothetical protein